MKEKTVERQEYSYWFVLSLFYVLLSYRSKAKICEVMHRGDGGYYLCPRCRTSLDRDFQCYCDLCGQHLDWAGYRKAKVIFPGTKH